jgi:tRNA A37 methylthiotransferase MiaB
MRPGLVDVLTGTEKVAPYFDLSFQHSAPAVLRRMRRFGGTEEFLALIERARALAAELRDEEGPWHDAAERLAAGGEAAA